MVLDSSHQNNVKLCCSLFQNLKVQTVDRSVHQTSGEKQ
jgi:hypothetical protein